MLQSIDLNLLPVLDRLIATQSLTRTAAHLGLSVPAVSRALGRIRLVVGDPVLVRSGRGLVLTPKGLALGEELRGCLDRIESLLRPSAPLPLREVRRRFCIRCNDVCAGLLAGTLFKKLRDEAPGIELRLEPETARASDALRGEAVDLDVGGSRVLPPETIMRQLYVERLVGVAHTDHPLFAQRITARRLMEHPHVLAAIQLDFDRPMQEALEQRSLQRTVGIVVPTFFAAATAACDSDLVATMPGLLGVQLQRFLPIRLFKLPLDLPAIPVHVAWHPRYENDSAHEWLRQRVIDEIKTAARSLGRLSTTPA